MFPCYLVPLLADSSYSRWLITENMINLLESDNSFVVYLFSPCPTLLISLLNTLGYQEWHLNSVLNYRSSNFLVLNYNQN